MRDGAIDTSTRVPPLTYIGYANKLHIFYANSNKFADSLSVLVLVPFLGHELSKKLFRSSLSVLYVLIPLIPLFSSQLLLFFIQFLFPTTNS